MDEIKVSKGKIIKTGDRLFIIDKEIWNANIQQATHQLDKAYANYANLSKGKRKQELEIILKQKLSGLKLISPSACQNLKRMNQVMKKVL